MAERLIIENQEQAEALVKDHHWRSAIAWEQPSIGNGTIAEWSGSSGPQELVGAVRYAAAHFKPGMWYLHVWLEGDDKPMLYVNDHVSLGFITQAVQRQFATAQDAEDGS